MTACRIRIAGKPDLPAINVVIAAALTSWESTERVKRLALPVYRYQQADLDHMWMFVAEGEDGDIAGVAALEEADPGDLPVPGYGLLLHGIFVKPGAMGAGIGQRLLRAGAGVTRELGYEGLLVKSVRQSMGFFEHCGLETLKATSGTDYPYRYWLSTAAPF